MKRIVSPALVERSLKKKPRALFSLAAFAIAVTLGFACTGEELPTPLPSATSTPSIPAATANPPAPTATPASTPTPTPRATIPPATPTSSPTPTATATPSVFTSAQLVTHVNPALGVVTSPAGRGSAFVIDKTGVLLTSSYLVRGVDTAQVQLPSLPEMTAAVLGRDEFTGIAVLRVNTAQDLPTLSLAGAERAVPGAEIAAFGFPQGATPGAPSISRGSILTHGRAGEVQYLQTDTVQDMGYHGGPLMAYNGQVVGVNTPRIEPASGQPVQGNGLAVHVASVQLQLPKLRRGAQYFRPSKREDFYPAGTTPPVPPFPNIFRGVVTLDGKPAQDGIRVYARIGRYVSNPVTVKDGKYPYLTVQPPSEDGFANKEIIFYVDGFPATPTDAYQANRQDPIQDLNLSAAASG